MIATRRVCMGSGTNRADEYLRRAISSMVAVGGCAILLAACSDVASDTPCMPGEAICDGDTHRVCEDGRFVNNERCVGGNICFPDFGCAQCDPTRGTACVGAAIHDCTIAGVVGDVVRDCGDSGCSQGRCNIDCGAAGVELIYVVDSDETLYSFDPSLIGTADPFSVIGTLDCPSAPALPTFSDGPGTPFSMSVDREGRAWVLYTSGQLFHASIVDASCTRVSYAAGQEGFELYGMGFVVDAPGAFTETLYISGGAAGANEVGNLGTINPVTLEVALVGPLTAEVINPRISPELTGTADAKLFGYYPGNETAVVEIHRGAGSELQGWELQPKGGELGGWAFAHWGGEYYIFLTTQFGSDLQSEVIRFSTADGSAETVIGETNKHIVGAGVSTCAPTTIE